MPLVPPYDPVTGQYGTGQQAYLNFQGNQNYYLVNGERIALFPNRPVQSGIPGQGTSPVASVIGPPSPAPNPPQFQFTFDTIGQVIYRSIGHCRLPLRTIWAQGINESGDTSTSNTQTFAAALCAPIDPLEDGEIFAIWAGGSQIFNSGGAVTPLGWSPEDAALLATSLASIVIFPGDEAQVPATLIVADKGADKTNAFRGLRYIIFQDFPINGGGINGSGIPPMTVGWQRNNDGDTPPGDVLAAEFLTGTG